jgi:predicted nucleic acid-binding protein
VLFWVLDSNLFFKMVEATDPALQPALDKLFSDANRANATLAITSVTVQEFLVRPRQLGEEQWHRARAIVDNFEVLSFDRAAAEEAAKIERYKAASLGTSNTEAKKIWFRDAAIVGTAIAKGAARVFTHDGPMAGMQVSGVVIERV